VAVTFGRAWALLLWPTLAVLVVWLGLQARGRGWLAVPLRLALVTLLVLALADPRRSAAADISRLVVLVDGSASVDPDALQQVRQAIAAARLNPPETLVAQFAESAQVIPDPARQWPDAPGREQATDLAAALEFAGQMLAGGRGSVLLISDGTAASGEALREAEALAAAGFRVDTLAVPAVAAATDVGVEAVHAPPSLWAGEPVSVTVSLYSVVPTAANLVLFRDGQPLAAAPLSLPAGEWQVTFSTQADAEGLMAFEAQVSAPGDGRPENDAAGAITVVQPPPSVLIVAQHQAAGNLLYNALTASAIRAQVIDPASLPASANALVRYQALILEDVSAEVLNLEQIKALEAYVYAHGRGLIVIGGQSAFSLGAYQGTPLERMLPVLLEPPIRSERPPATLLLIVDRSGSMNGIPIQLAKEAAMRAVEILQPNDRLGVLAFNTDIEWQVPLGTLGEGLALRDVLDTIAGITPGGGTDILKPLDAGLTALAGQPTDRRHIVLLSDGKSAGAYADFQALVQTAAAAGISVSTIAIGPDADQQLLADIAEWGKGRYHLAAAPEDIPGLVLAESRAVESDAIQQGEIQPRITLAHPLVSNFAAADLPPLDAYVALTARPRAEADMVLASPLDDPLLAAWQYGLGRVVAWTSDMDGDWTSGWAGWPGLPRFWAQVIRYALPDPSQGTAFAEASLDGRAVTVTVLAAGDDGQGINLADGQLSLALPGGEVTRLPLLQTAPGEYSATFVAPEPGVYRGQATLQKTGQAWNAPVGFVVGYPPEFSPRLTADLSALDRIAGLTGGQRIESLEAVERPVVGLAGGDGFGPWLLAAAVLLWPIEIAIRRRWMPWRGA
jgi:uncharacterized membrane protein